MQGELKQIADLALFAKIVQTGGISRCATDLGMERTTVSRRLGALERELGVKLLDRTPKHIEVTDAGQRCLEQCEQLLESAQNAQSLATVGSVMASTEPTIIGAPPDFMNRYLEPKLAAFEDHNPGVRIERLPVSIWTEEAIESVDMGIALAPIDVKGTWTNTIAHLRQSIYASVDYAAQHDPVLSPFDLESHDSIIERSDSERHSWQFERNGKVTTVTVHAKYIVSSLLEAREATLAGLGISRLPEYLCEPYLRSGGLVDLMPDTVSQGRNVIIVNPRHRKHKTGTTALRIYLERAFSKEIN